jgi:O-antigen ligase
VGSYAIFLTHTRAVYLGFGLVLILGMVLARGFRTGFVAVAVTAAGIVALNWGTFVSTDRAAGGIGSPNELHDRLNSMATGIWAFEQKPWFGWGIGRFVAVNSYHHQQWSQDIPWIRGLGISSHLNELGILAELGLVGLALWLCVLVTIVVLLVRTYRRLPAESAGGLRGRRLLFVALAALMAQFVAGLFADLRLFDFPTALVLLLVGVALRPPKDTADAAAPSPVHSSSGAVRLVPPARDRAVREEAL